MSSSLDDLTVGQRRAFRVLREAGGWTLLKTGEAVTAARLVEFGLAERRPSVERKNHLEWRLSARGLALCAVLAIVATACGGAVDRNVDPEPAPAAAPPQPDDCRAPPSSLRCPQGDWAVVCDTATPPTCRMDSAYHRTSRDEVSGTDYDAPWVFCCQDAAE